MHAYLVTFTMILCASCTLVHAEDVFDLSLEELQNIKVNVASLFEDNPLDVASSTAVLYQRDWQNRGTSTLGHTLEAVPSVFAGSTWGGSEVLAIRGYATELSVRGISYTMNGIPLSTYTYANTGYAIPRMPLPLIQQVEMIRGPGSALYGSDAFHGVLAFELANEPVSTTIGNTQLGANKQQVNLLNSSIAPTFNLHWGVAYEQEGPYDTHYDYTDPFNGETRSSERDQSSQNMSAYLSANTGEIHGKGKWSALFFFNEFEASEFQGIGRQFFLPLANAFDLESTSLSTNTDTTDTDSNFLLVGLTHEKALGDTLQLKNQVYFWQSEHLWTFDNRGYPDSLTTLGGTPLACKQSEASLSPNPLYCSHIRTQQDDEQRLGYQIQLKQKQETSNTQWAIGAGYDEITITDSRFERRDLNGDLMIGYDNAFKDDTRYLSHILAQARTGFSDNQWLLSYGFRWDSYSDANDHLSPRIGLVHKINSHWRQKLLYGHAYRAPTALELKGSSASVLGNVDLDPEIIDTYEYILMYQKTNLQLEAVVFASEWQDAIALVPVSSASSTNRYQNIKDNHAQGLEMSVRKTIHNWSVMANASYVESENKSDNLDYQAFPKVMLSMNVENHLSQSMSLGLWYRHMQDYALGDDALLFADRDQQYHRFDVYGGYQVLPDTKIGFNVFNLFDQALPLPSYYGSENGWQDVGRQVNIHLQQRF